MHIEFIDQLRCPEAHDETWLVAVFNKTDGRDVVEAKLACPLCKREFLIHRGVGIFGEAADGSPGERETASPEQAMEIAAFLDLAQPGKVALLAGELAAQADEVAQLSEARVIALNPVSPHASQSPQVATIRSNARVPVASKSLDGVALDELHSTQLLLGEAARLLRPKGRLVASASALLPTEFRELARDETRVVAEQVGTLVKLARPAPR